MNNYRQGTKISVDMEFIAATGLVTPSGLLPATANVRYRVLGYNLTVPSGIIGVKFEDDTSDISGIHLTTKDAPWQSKMVYQTRVGEALYLSTDSSVANVKGDIWYEEEQLYSKQTTNLNKMTVAAGGDGTTKTTTGA